MDLDQVIGTAKDSITVRRVFADPYERDGITVITAARVAGGGGGGSGKDERGPQGEGGGFGVNASPAGAFVIQNGKVTWQPAVDPNRVVAAVAAIIVAVVLSRGWVRSRMAKSLAHAPTATA
jgi:uncharacterized spore protein YtfJ